MTNSWNFDKQIEQEQLLEEAVEAGKPFKVLIHTAGRNFHEARQSFAPLGQLLKGDLSGVREGGLEPVILGPVVGSLQIIGGCVIEAPGNAAIVTVNKICQAIGQENIF